jgi:hypothetical protein
MNKHIEKSKGKSSTKSNNSTLYSNEYRKFLERLGIDPTDFDDPIEIEIDDYSR